jgi:phospholipid/cholesterol/gamma-HCH transport system permease protein
MQIPLIADIAYILGFLGRILKSVWFFITRGVASYNVLVMQILFTFVEAFSLAALLAVGIGAAVDVLGLQFLSALSQEKLIYPLLIIIITRELGPLLTAFIIIARSATAIATEVAGMVVSHEVEAYISVGLDPLEHICVPRFLGVTISVFLLNVYFSVFGLAGSFVVAQFFTPMNAAVFFSNLLQALTIPDIVISFLKSVVFGTIIALSALVRGFGVERASTEIPVAGLKAVGSSFVWCIVADILLSAVYYAATA